MKKRAIKIIGAVLFIILFALSLYIPSADNIGNLKEGLENDKIMLSAENMPNWTYSDGVFTSQNDPQIILSGVECYVHTVKLPVQIKLDGKTPVQVFYTENKDETFSEEKKLLVNFSIRGSSTYITVDRDVYSLRIDLTEEAGLSLRMNRAEINDRSLIVGFSAICTYCVAPMLLLGALFVLIFGRTQIRPYLAKLKKYLPLLQNLVSRDLKVKYRRSALGFLWSVLNPLLMALVINAVFSRLFRFDIQYFAVYYLSGSLIFNFVVECTTNSMTSVLDAASLIKKVYIPKYIFPLEKCCFAFINMLFSSVAVVVVMIIQGVPFSFTALLFPIPMIYAFFFAYGFSLVLSSLMVFFRDMQHLYSVWTMIWMYLTPIIYPETLLVENGLGFIMKANPMYYYTHYIRELVMYGNIPSLSENMICFVFAGVMLVIGGAVFNKAQDKFILYI